MRKLGFTLAEVLITLVIIGVIAAMTVPSLMQNTNAQEYRSALKKAISGLNQALQLNYALDGTVPGDFDSTAEVVSNIFKTRMSVMEDTDSNSWTAGLATARDVACAGTVFTTQDGIKFCLDNFTAVDSDTGACNVYNTEPCGDGGNIIIDVNGDRKPNMMTTSAKRPRDIYKATLYSQKVVPYGDATQGVMYDKEANASSAAS